ncbi:Hypothetical predicted protein [Octopus vulgaris]|uniref:Uncharacterized protein n=1 Tax=Octopus vulgaris TaxID=6645 RepID=A0AA36F420_OCTVU|nr:Hypothetical predicted protein [Octopus vulgaris]
MNNSMHSENSFTDKLSSKVTIEEIKMNSHSEFPGCNGCDKEVTCFCSGEAKQLEASMEHCEEISCLNSLTNVVNSFCRLDRKFENGKYLTYRKRLDC